MTSKSPWFRCFPDSYLHGVSKLNDELGMAYTRLFMAMYADHGPLPFDPQQLKLLLGKRPQDCRRIVDALVALGKLTVEDGFIHNKRTAYELRRRGQMEAKWPANDNQMPDEMNGKWTGQNGEKHNKSYARTGDRMRPNTEEDEDKKKEAGGERPSTASEAAGPLPSKVGATGSARAAALAVEAAALPALDVEPEPPSNPALVRQLIEQGTKRPRSLAEIANDWKEED